MYACASTEVRDLRYTSRLYSIRVTISTYGDSAPLSIEHCLEHVRKCWVNALETVRRIAMEWACRARAAHRYRDGII